MKGPVVLMLVAMPAPNVPEATGELAYVELPFAARETSGYLPDIADTDKAEALAALLLRELAKVDERKPAARVGGRRDAGAQPAKAGGEKE